MKSNQISAAVLLAAFILFPGGNGFACGPDFPNNLLNGGDHAVLQAPVADFQRELERMNLVRTKVRVVPPAAGQRYYEQATELEMADLAASLKRRKISREQAVVIMQAHLAERMKLNAYLKARHEWDHTVVGGYSDDSGYHELPNTNPPPVFPEVAVTPGLPSEFALYFRGAIRWSGAKVWWADQPWEQLLDLPPGERHYKSTWAAFMLGKYYDNPTNDWAGTEALKYFEQVRVLARDGFADSSGLAAASMVDAARIYLRQKNYERALELYLEQFAAGDDGAAQSLRITAAGAVAETGDVAALEHLARNPRTRRVITAYLISRNPYIDPHAAENDAAAGQFFDRTKAWLKAIETADVKNVECASELALAAYQASQMDAAQRWINRAGGEPVAQWLQAKLFMRAGKVPEAARLLAKLSRKFPQELPGTNMTTHFADSLFVNICEYNPDNIAIGQQVLGELGVLHLARREFTESLDALIHSGYWGDAAYVAERVLTTGELKKYVDQNWRLGSNPPKSIQENPDKDPGRTDTGEKIRWLLGRRLARENRFTEARGYFPAAWRPQLDSYAAKVRDGRDEKLAALLRAKALFAASRMMRTNGMELFGTELQPDWFVEDGNFQVGVTWQDRTASSAGINSASSNEVARAAAHRVDPEERWHYRELALRLRDQAGDLAWEAAKIMPDNTDTTARFLCTAGRWKRSLVEQDKFYKALVRRCRKTPIGEQADRMRWFPILDDNGNPKPWPPPRRKMQEADNSVPTRMTNSAPVIIPGAMDKTTYIVRSGDTLLSVAKNFNITLKQLNTANTNLDFLKLCAGQVITIPTFVASDTNSPP